MDMNYEIMTKKLELRHAFTISRSTSNEKNNIFVKIEKDGIVGWGEAAPNTRYRETPESSGKALDVLCRNLPEDLRSYGPFLEQMNELVPGEYAAKAAMDIAVMDWVGQYWHIPLHRLWGLDPALMPVTSMTIAIASPEEMAERTGECKAFDVLKIKLGTDHDRAIIEAIRRKSDQLIRIDANEGWKDRETAIREIEWLAERNVEIIEQPMPAEQVEDMIWLKKRSPLPLIADEAFTSVNSMVELADAYHGVNIKLAKCGGTYQGRRAVCLARSMGLSVMLGCMVESSVGIAAAAQLAPLVDFADLDGNLLIGNDPFIGHPVVDAAVKLNDEAGLGVHLKALS
jgi:L-alanine-DL-glutamate epimerase-like enolase superfamily enzyme